MGMAAMLVMWPGPFEQFFVPKSPRGYIWNLVTIDLMAFEEMCEIVKIWETRVKGQTMTLTSCTH